MSSNQRARLVQNPLFVVAVLLVTSFAVAGGWLMLRDRSANAATESASAGTPDTELVLSSTELDFGRVVPQRPVMRQLLLRNHGSETARVRIEGSDKFVVDPRELDVASGNIGRVFLTARSVAPGPWEEEIRVVHANSDAAPQVVRLRGSSPASAGATAAAQSAGEAAQQTVAALVAEDAAVDAEVEGLSPQHADANAADPAGAPGSVQITRSSSTAEAGGTAGTGASSTAPGEVTLPGGYVRVPRSMSEPPQTPTGDAPVDGEEAAPLPRRGASDIEKKPKDRPTNPGAAVFAVSDRSSVTLLGTLNRFYLQQLPVLGTASGGSFTLSGALQFPSIPLAFGQSMQLSQRGPAVGTFNSGTGQVVLSVAVDAVDSNGHSAPFVVQLTTGSVVTRNSNGVLITVAGESRSEGTGLMRLVGIAKIPEGYRNGAEMELVTFEILATLQFASPASDSTAENGGGE
jgi:hypothetical protein